MNLKEKLMEDHPQLSEMKIEQIIEESEEKVGRGAEMPKEAKDSKYTSEEYVIDYSEDRQVINEEWIRQLIREEVEKYFERQVPDFD